jgi:hypothetical protein
MFWKLRSTAFALAFILVTLVTGTAAQALPLSEPSFRGEESFLENAWEWLTSSFLAKAGGMMDPNGNKAGGMMDPNGFTVDAGGMMDPNGACLNAGGMMDPNGNW